ncbi:flagellar motor switch protein FliN [Microvenator marinus]|jgi:flagellar motor switch protein FliN/FliY|uniref:Flagellar motor switch protein FliN n=1 Tax=Microvenator marinus TaxID=2600177 RepID=A0A5B8XRP3_9DELT|nr:flagellar motor switch protein FliN [Microvenator marinus]QED28622.1 flagellar motor switch protein FliN [Microvenator marinus]
MSNIEESSELMAQPSEASASLQKRALDFLSDVPLEITVELGRTKLSIAELLKLGPSSVLELNKASGDPLEIRANGVLIARGEAVVVNDRFGVRLSSIVTPDRLLGSMNGGE